MAISLFVQQMKNTLGWGKVWTITAWRQMKAMHCSRKTELQQGWEWHCATGVQEISLTMQDIHRTQESHGSPRGALDLPLTPRILYTIWAGHRHLKMSDYSIKWMVMRTRSTVENKWRMLLLTCLVTPWGPQGYRFKVRGTVGWNFKHAQVARSEKWPSFRSMSKQS